MVHMNITFPEELKHKLDHEAKREKTKRSTLIQRAVRFYLGVKTQKEKNLLLKEECLAFSDEAKQVMDAFKSVDAETLKYLDN